MFTLGIGLGIDGSNVLPESLNRQNNCLRARFDVHSCVEEVSAKSSWEEYTYLLPEAQLCRCVWQQEAVNHVRLLPTHAGRKYSFSSPSPQSVVGAPITSVMLSKPSSSSPAHACTRRSQEVPWTFPQQMITFHFYPQAEGHSTSHTTYTLTTSPWRCFVDERNEGPVAASWSQVLRMSTSWLRHFPSGCLLWRGTTIW